jgi:methylmalonyl-CoA mutase
MTTDRKDLKKQMFPSYKVEDWIAIVKTSLKNETIDSLNRETYENIKLKPLYTKEDLAFLQVEQYPGFDMQTRGFHPLGYRQKPWAIAQKIVKHDWTELKQLLTNALNHGQDALSFDLDAMENVDEINFAEMDYSEIPFFLLTKNYFEPILEKVMKVANVSPFGVIATDIISSNIHKGKIVVEDSDSLNNWVDHIKEVHQSLPNIKTFLVDTTPYHNGGANAVQELAIALAEAIFYIEYMKNHEWKPEQTVNKMVFHFAIGGNFFMEIAKLRAFRTLWTTIGEAYELARDDQKVTVSAETSTFTKSTLDPFVNMLRSGNEAFAAILGGIDYLHVSPYDEVFQENGDFSARVSRNTQLVLREESHLDKVSDPAGGSYYIESLTNELVEKAWGLFQTIDAMGGIVEGLKSGWVQNEIKQVLNNRLHDVATKKQSVIGTNVYANLAEKVASSKLNREETDMSITPIIPTRLSNVFEHLRERAFLLQSNGNTPVAGLINLGKLKDHKTRADFVTSVLATAAIKAEWSQECRNLEDVKKFVQGTRFSYYCICGTDEAYKVYSKLVGEWLKEEYSSIKVDIAGKFSNEELEQLRVSGVEDSIHLNQNMIGKLTSLLDVWEVQKHD